MDRAFHHLIILQRMSKDSHCPSLEPLKSTRFFFTGTGLMNSLRTQSEGITPNQHKFPGRLSERWPHELPSSPFTRKRNGAF